MKKQTLFVIVMIFSILQLQATVRTVSNHVTGGAQYTSLTAAYNAASNGDTLLIEGTGTIYEPSWGCGNFWSKSLVVIGAGYNPATASGSHTMFGDTDCWGELMFAVGSSGSKFYGIEFTQGINFYANLNEFVFENCKFNQPVYCNDAVLSNIAFINCVFDENNTTNIYLTTSNGASFSFLNCVFDGRINGYNNANISLIIDRCLFLQTTADILYNVKSPVVSNSIFMNNASIANINTTGGTYNYNIARLGATLPPATASGTGNMVNTDPLFVSYTAGTNYSAAHDYALQPGSPAIGTGAGGSDIGVHSGNSNFSETGEPLNAPVMRSMVILNSTVEPGGTLNVEVSASKPNND